MPATTKKKAGKTAKTARAVQEKVRMPKTTHHCPVCKEAPTKRCENKGHLVRCKIHPVHLHGIWYQCHECKKAVDRLIEQERRMKKEQKEREEVEAAKLEASRKVRTKERHRDKKKQEEEEGVE